MSEYEALRTDLHTLSSSMDRYSSAVNSHANAVDAELARLWADNAELRDELHAVANRLENLTRAITTEPAEVAERMIFTCRLNPGCNVSWPHIHNADGAVIRVESADDADHALAEVERVRQLYPRAFGGDAS